MFRLLLLASAFCAKQWCNLPVELATATVVRASGRHKLLYKACRLSLSLDLAHVTIIVTADSGATHFYVLFIYKY